MRPRESVYEKYGIKVPKLSEDKTIVDLIESNVLKYPDKYLLVYEGRKYKRKEIFEAAKRFATFLRQSGIGEGDRVAIALPNIPQMVIACYGTWIAGATVVALNPLYTDRELSEQLAMTQSKMVVILDIFCTKVANTGLTIVVTSAGELAPLHKRILYAIYSMSKARVPKGAIKWKETMSCLPSAVRYDKPQGVATILFSGGTTGKQKAVLSTHKSIVNAIEITDAVYYQVRESMSARHASGYTLPAVPFFHVYGLVMGHLYVVTTSHATNILMLLPSTKKIVKLIKKYKVVLLHLVPEQYDRIVKHADKKKMRFDTVELCISTAGKLSRATFENTKRVVGAYIAEAYGMTEAPPITLHPYPVRAEKQDSVGLIAPHVEVKIVDVDDPSKELGIGEYGEILVRGPNILAGYNEIGNNEGFVDGWFATGDCGFVDEEGWLYIAGRKKEMVNVNGFKVYAKEIEEILMTIPGVKEGCMIGEFSPLGHCGAFTPDANDEIVTVVVVKDDPNLTKEKIIEYFRERVAPYKVPKEVRFVDKLPRNTLGKILKEELKRS